MIYEIFRVIGVILGWPLQFLFFKRKTYYEDKKSVNLYKGGKLIVCNHYNMFDYVLGCFIVFPRKLYAVASEVPFRSPIVRFGMKFFGAIEANRETRSMKFLNESAAVLKKGHLVQIFPEGQNTPDGKIHDFYAGYVLIAHRGNVPIVPIITDGNYGLFKRVSVIIGKEINVQDFMTSGKKNPTREEIEKVNEYVHQKCLELREELEVRKAKKGKKTKKDEVV